jgi:ankyrin repeat protein
MDLITACITGNLKEVKRLIQEGNCDKDVALKYAVNNGHTEVVKYLVEKGARIDPLWKKAIEEGKIDAVIWLTRNQIDISEPVDKKELAYYIEESLLEDAVYEERDDIVDFLLNLGIPVNLERILLYAATNERECLVEYLVKRGVDPAVGDNWTLKRIMSFAPSLTELLVEHGADIHTQYEYPLRYAIYMKDVEDVRYFLQLGANPAKLEYRLDIVEEDVDTDWRWEPGEEEFFECLEYVLTELTAEEILPFLLSDDEQIRETAKKCLEAKTA